MAGRISKWFAELFRERPWHGIAELRDVPSQRAEEMYGRAIAHTKWRRAWWGGVGLSVLLWGLALWVTTASRRLVANEDARFWINMLVIGLLAGLAPRLYYRITLPVLRRCIRAELGTHCSQCDYDLRGTPDAIPPQVARCPECGKPIARNVHRQTIPDDAPGDPAAAALLRRKGSD